MKWAVIVLAGILAGCENQPDSVFMQDQITGWIVDGVNENIEPMHVRLTKVDDPTTHITVSVDVLTDPRHFQRPVPDL